MRPAPQDFCVGITLDNALLRADIVREGTAPITEIISLAAAAQAIYLFAVTENRELDRVQDQCLLWREVSELFNKLTQAWTDVTCDDESITWLRTQLEHYRALCEDRKVLYTITEEERRRHSKTRDSEIVSFGERHGTQPAGYPNQSSPAHIYQLGQIASR